MLQVSRFDIKTGVTLQATIAGVQRPSQKTISNAYLEHWLSIHGLESPFYVGRFYDGVNEADRLRLEAQGKVLVFTNGKDGYFTDPVTAQRMTMGDPALGIGPIYAGDRTAPHNLVAYGSLIASDGIASTAVSQARILVIDDEQRSAGDAPLYDCRGLPISMQQLAPLFDKMGDGTMLIAPQVMHRLITAPERAAIAQRVFKKAGIAVESTAIAPDLPQSPGVRAAIDRQVATLANQIVSQFRAATPDLPGLIKGTMAVSHWCEQLGVEAILSRNDIKGDDGRLSTPGIQAVTHFWINRKSDARYGEQAVGPQVKGCIPDATRSEFNPQMIAQAQAIAQVATDPLMLRHYYIQQKERQRERLGEPAEDAVSENRPEWLYAILKADRYGQLFAFSKINRELERYLKGEWLDCALRGIYVPSAMAQHHAQLHPWEVCNKDLPHGAIVAYYRSPFPNVGAAAIAINNTVLLQECDREAFLKAGVAYLNPWTAKNIAITDFDRDANGYFVGYSATVADLPQQIRQQLTSVLSRPPAEQYEAGRALFGQMIAQLNAGQEHRITPAAYPLAVAEFITRNAPDCKPPEITKQPKIKHPWRDNETLAAATWRAWSITADNPTGKVANVGMTLQSLALETLYAPASQKEGLLRQISTHYLKQLQRVDAGTLFIPDDDWLSARGFPAYHFRERVLALAQANLQLAAISDPHQRLLFVEGKLQIAFRLLSDVVDGPNAMNLQAAVDSAKSARGIDAALHTWAKALSYKEHLLRQHAKDYDNYVDGKLLPTNTQEPIGWGVDAVNRTYQTVQLPELNNEAFRDLVEKCYTPEQERQALAIARTYNSLVQQAIAVKERLRENRPEDQQPTLGLTTADGRVLTVQLRPDPEGMLPIWGAAGLQPRWEITVRPELQVSSVTPRFLVFLHVRGSDGDRPNVLLGEVSPESVERFDLAQQLQRQPAQAWVIVSPQVQLRPPLAQENDVDALLARAVDYAQAAVAQIPLDQRAAYLSALWRQSDGMGFALKHFTDLLGDRLQTVPEITLTGLQRDTNQVGLIPAGEYTVRFSEYSYLDNAGVSRTTPSVAIVSDDGIEQSFGALSPRSIHLPLGTTVRAQICIDASGKTARLQVLNVADAPVNPEIAAVPSRYDFLPAADWQIAAEQGSAYSAKSSLLSGQPLPMVFPLRCHGAFHPLPVEIYSPSRQELRDWCAVAIARRDEPLKAQIIAVGTQLKALYGQEVGIPGATPPLDYRHPLVVISAGDRLQMQQDQEALQQALQAAATTIHSPAQSRHGQWEVG